MESQQSVITKILSGNLSTIPPELLYLITLNNLGPRDILRLDQTSKYFHNKIGLNSNLWKQLYERDISSRIDNISDFKDSYNKIMGNINKENNDERLVTASIIGWEKMVEQLVKNGANVNYKNNLALSVAKARGHNIGKHWYY